MRRRALLAGLLAAPLARAQGFAGLGSEAAGFAPVAPGRAFVFPADHGPHPGFRIEWWYLTLLLDAADGRRFGAQFTLFRTALRPDAEAEGWASRVIWLGHAALTSAERHLSAERIARGGIGIAGAQAAPFAAWIEEWRLEEAALLARDDQPGTAPALRLGQARSSSLSLTVDADAFALDLRAARPGPIVLQGENGYSVKSGEGHASYYYSLPFIEGVSGDITLDGAPIPVAGRGWLDREWSSQPLSGDQSGWDWFGLHLAGGEKLTLFRLRNDDDANFLSATVAAPDGSGRRVEGAELTPLDYTDIGGRRIPTGWRLRLPALGLDGTLTPLNPRAFNALSTPYWEGPVTLGGPRPAEGYMELTGY